MKLIIITVFDSYNWGSYLQALALSSVLSKFGESFLLKTGARGVTLPFLKQIMKSLRCFSLKQAIFEVRKFCVFKVNHRKLKIVNCLPNADGKTALIFGSDEIWNISRAGMKKFPLFWGEGFEGYKKISYAPSIGNSSKDDYLSAPNYISLLSRFSSLSVRDNHSLEVLTGLINKDIRLVLDPTFLLSKDDWSRRAEKIKEKNYIALYLHRSHVTAQMISQIQAIAKVLGKRLISLNLYYSWCDQNVASINVFDYYLNADYVITTTFHGTAFAINFNKQFVTFSDATKRNKVCELLEQFGLGNRNGKGLDTRQLIELLQEPINYSSVNEMMENYRKNSFDYLREALG